MYYRFTLIPGDGIGPEVTDAVVEVLRATGIQIDWEVQNAGAAVVQEHGTPLPDQVLDSIRRNRVALKGPVTTPVGKGFTSVNVTMRKKLNLYACLRPVRSFTGIPSPWQNVDLVVVRENTEGLYAGAGGFLKYGTPDEVAVQESINTRKGVDRCLKFAFELTRKRNRAKKLTLVAKTNVLTFASNLWFRAFEAMAPQYPDVTTNYAHVDATCMWFVKNPEWFDVVVTDNLFGDIITDLGAMIQGGMGVAAGGNINPEGVSMFEPIGGSAPKYTGLQVVNPLAAIAATQMMLEQLGAAKAAAAVEAAIKRTAANDMLSMAAGKMGLNTSQVGDKVAQYAVEMI